VSQERIFWVGQFKIRSGMDGEALAWWREKGQPDILAEPCTKSLRAYAVQFALGGEHTVEIWQELENYAALDMMEKDFQRRPEFYAEHMQHLREADNLLEWGPARLIGEWPKPLLITDEENAKTNPGPFWVGQFKIRSGMDGEALAWWREKGEPDVLAEPCTKSLKAYAVQFALGGEYTVEIWQELENYAVLDMMEKDFQRRPEFYAEHMQHLREADNLLEWGPARLMNWWPNPP
jgi:hypothetical protein